MNILEKILNFFGIEKRAESSEGTVMVSYDSDFFAALVGAGNPITKQKALEIPAVQFCIELLSGLISALPVKLYEEAEDGKVIEIKNDVRVRLLNGDTGDTLNGTMFRRLWVRDYFLGGGAYAYIERDIYGMPAALYYVEESRLSTIPNCKAIFKDYSVSVDGNIYPKSDFLKILRNSKGNGKGAGIVSESGTMLATAYNTMLYENSIVKKGGNKKGFFTSQNQQTKEAMQAIKEAWGKMNSTSQGVEDNVAVLNAGMDFKEVSLSAMDMQLNQNKQTNSGEVCGIFGVPPSMMSGTASPEAKENFITDTLTPLLNIFETAFDSDLLLEAEKGRRYFAFDTRELTRGDILKRYQAYAIGKEKGFIQIDDIRELEDMPPLNIPFVNLGLGDVLYNPETGEIYTPNTDRVVNIRELGWSLRNNDKVEPEENLDNSEELRFNPYHDLTNGRFTSGNSGAYLFSSGGKSAYVYGAKLYGGGSNGNIDKLEKSGIIKSSNTVTPSKSFDTGEQVNDFFYYDGEERGILARKNSEHGRWLSSLSQEQRKDIGDYCADGYADINNYWRKHGDWQNINAEKVLSQTNSIDSAIASYNLKESIKTYRAIKPEAFLDYADDIQKIVGTEYTDSAFMSTSPFSGSTGVNKECIMEITVPAGKGRGAYINQLSGQHQDREYEFLLARNSRFKITSASTTEEKIIIGMEMITDD